MRAHEEAITVHLGRRPNVLTILTSAMALSLTAGMIGAFVERGQPSPRALPYVVLALSSSYLLASAVYLYFRATYLRISGAAITLDKRRGSVSVRPPQITHISYFKQSWLRSLYTIESRDGTTIRFALLGKPTLQNFQKALDEIERVTSLQWVGRSSRASFGDFVAALRDAIGARSNGALAKWALLKMFHIRGDEVGGNDPLMRWGYLTINTALGVALLGFEFLLLGFIQAPGAAAAIIAVIWILTSLGVNILLVLMRQHVRGRETLQAELDAAREVQEALLPAKTPRLPGFEMSGVCIPAREVGGDYFDFIESASEGCAVVVADVSGKGMAAALLMTLAKGALTTRLLGGDSLTIALSSVNQVVRTSSGRNMFVSMAIARVQRSGRISVVRAGHNPPLMLRANGAVEQICPPGVALGLTDEDRFAAISRAEDIHVAAGDLLILFTDGVTEAMDADAQQYGDERLVETVRRNRHRAAAEIKDAVLDDVTTFRGAAAIHDDLTVVVIKAT